MLGQAGVEPAFSVHQTEVLTLELLACGAARGRSRHTTRGATARMMKSANLAAIITLIIIMRVFIALIPH